jgi:hypothetical protein
MEMRGEHVNYSAIQLFRCLLLRTPSTSAVSRALVANACGEPFHNQGHVCFYMCRP